MAIVSLLTYPDDTRGQAAFSFDHAHEHGKLVDAMADPSAFNLPHYLLDPVASGGMGGAALWSIAHQQAHDDAANWFNVQPSLQLTDGNPDAMWAFINHSEHVALAGAALAASG